MLPQNDKQVSELNLSVIKERTETVIKEASIFTLRTIKVPIAFLPLSQLLISSDDTTREQLSDALDALFDSLYDHPLTKYTHKLTIYLRKHNLIPNEQTTENLIMYVVNQVIARSPFPIPDLVIKEFWIFFKELFSEPEIKGLMELNLDIIRVVLKTYEPLIVDIINLLKETHRINQIKMKELIQKINVIQSDLIIIKRQVKALRYIKPFFQADPRDFSTQAQIVAKMVREFGPFFIKMAQAAAANSDFLPEEIAKELAVFQEDVEPMTANEVLDAFDECYHKTPYDFYLGFDAHKPLKSGSIGSVYLARKPVIKDGKETLVPVIVKVGRHNLDREFLMGKTVLGVAIISSQYWAPHSKLAPFLEAMRMQIDEFVEGFQRELDFEEEAKIQERFAKRSSDSTAWHVPKVYLASSRILEMEYLEGSINIQSASRKFKAENAQKYRRKLADNFLYTVLLHMWMYNEFHGDLHPGNVMVNKQGLISLIDWGNAVNMDGKWKPVWDYLSGTLLANPEIIADALINISTAPIKNNLRREHIVKTLKETIKNKKITPINSEFINTLRKDSMKKIYKQFITTSKTTQNIIFKIPEKGLRKQIALTASLLKELYTDTTSGGMHELHARFQLAMHLMSNTQHMNIVIRSEYLHLSRSLFAMVGTYASMYDGMPTPVMITDFLRVLGAFPLMLMSDRFKVKKKTAKKDILQSMPFPMVLKNYIDAKL